jgi:hypothetical protein
MPSGVNRYRTIALAGVLALAAVTPGATGILGAGTPGGPVASNRLDGLATPRASPQTDELGSGTPSPQLKQRAGAPLGTNSPGPTLTPTPSATPALTVPPTPRPTPPPPPPPPSGPWPGPTNTGVPAGTPLVASGSITLTVAGTLIDALDISGCISVQTSNVIIKRTRVRGGLCGTNQIQIKPGVSGVLIEDTEVDGSNQNAFYAGIGGTGFTCLRCNVHGVGQGFNINADLPTVIQDSYVHDLYACCGSHNEDIYVGDANPASLTIRHNTLSNAHGQTSAISLFADFGPIQHVTIDHNLLNGGGYTLYGGSSCPKSFCTQTASIVVTNNHFGRLYYSNCGQYGPMTAFDPARPGNVWSGNLWDDTGQPITA